MAGILPLNKYVVFVLALISCRQILLTEGRPINSMNNLQQSKIFLSGKEQMQPGREFVDFSAATEDDFRPTTPGYSPGVGHPKAVATRSNYNIPVNVQQSASGMSTPVVARNGYHASGETPKSGEFRPSAPANEHSVTGSKDDYRPTQPGHSPGVGHSYPNAKQP